MNIILLTEYFDPIIGGATHMTKKVAEYVQKAGHDVTLVVPSESSVDSIIEKSNEYPYRIAKIGLNTKIISDLNRSSRINFCYRANNFIKNYNENNQIDVVHIVAGIYLLKYIDAKYFKSQNIKTVASIMNVPPQECSVSWKGDNFLFYLKDKLRKLAVKYINKRRILANVYDKYTTISEHSKLLLSEYISADKIVVTDLGTENLSLLGDRSTTFPKNGKLKILTVGGFVPHKNQHIIPLTAQKLRANNIDFEWIVIGPIRNERYKIYILNLIEKLNLKNYVMLKYALPQKELFDHYRTADIYVQMSTEEGFCMTALDANFFGVPLIGTKAGSIPQFIERGVGFLADNSPNGLYEAIKLVIQNPQNYIVSQSTINGLSYYYSWDNVAKKLTEIYG